MNLGRLKTVGIEVPPKPKIKSSPIKVSTSKASEPLKKSKMSIHWVFRQFWSNIGCKWSAIIINRIRREGSPSIVSFCWGILCASIWCADSMILSFHTICCTYRYRRCNVWLSQQLFCELFSFSRSCLDCRWPSSGWLHFFFFLFVTCRVIFWVGWFSLAHFRPI